MYQLSYKGITFKTLYTLTEVNRLKHCLSHIQVKKVEA